MSPPLLGFRFLARRQFLIPALGLALVAGGLTGIFTYLHVLFPDVTEFTYSLNYHTPPQGLTALGQALLASSVGLVSLFLFQAGWRRLNLGILLLLFFLLTACQSVVLSVFYASTPGALPLVLVLLFFSLCASPFVNRARSLGLLGNLLLMLGLELFLGVLVNVFMHNPLLQLNSAGASGVFIALLVAWDVRRLKAHADDAPNWDFDTQARLALEGGLTFYLDFMLCVCWTYWVSLP